MKRSQQPDNDHSGQPSLALSVNTVNCLQGLASSASYETPGGLAHLLAGLDAYYAAVLLGDDVVYFGNDQDCLCPECQKKKEEGIRLEATEFLFLRRIVCPSAYQERDDFKPDDIAQILVEDARFGAMVRDSGRRGQVISESGGEIKRRPVTESDLDRLVRVLALFAVHDIYRAVFINVPLLGSQFEGPLLICHHVSSSAATTTPRPTRELVLQTCREIWDKGAMEGNSLKKHRFFTVSIPFFLSLVFAESKDFADTPKILRQLRDSKETASFRRWLTDMDKESSLPKFTREYREVEALAQSMLEGFGAGDFGSTLQVGISPSLQLPLTPVVNRLKEFKRPHLKFIRRMLRASSQNARLEQQVAKLLPVTSSVCAEAVALLESK